ncbi:hypothetical protein GCM10022224_080540 [Nonomuraea antimicrobica]|uniref:Uncharacterized protein n=1 Tax=Nonomuraea antimicrobica TaxID=561173 RepID=A0ABP7DES6_9ACTN
MQTTASRPCILEHVIAPQLPDPLPHFYDCGCPDIYFCPNVRRGRVPSPQRVLRLLRQHTRPYPRADARASHLIIPSAVVPPEGEADMGHGVKVEHPAGRTTLTPWFMSARLVPGRRRAG